MREYGAAGAPQLLIWELILRGTLSLVFVPNLEALVSQWAAAPTATPPHTHTYSEPLCPSPAYLLYPAEDPQQISAKDAPELFLTPASPQQLLYEYWVCGHVLQTLWEPAWPPAS